MTVYKYRHHLSIAKNDVNRFFVVELGGYLSKDWHDYVQLARSTPLELSVVEECWGVWSALRRTFFNWPVDSIIHALGNTRNVAKLSMQRADMVISTRRTSYLSATKWQPWNLSQNYWFYENLLTGYAISSWSPNTIVWRKTDFAALATRVQCEPVHSASHTALQVTIFSPGYYEVEMQYKVNSKGRSLVMVQNNINWAADASGYISINPKANQAKFPAYFKTTEHAQLNVKVVGNRDATIDLLSCSAKQMAFRNEEVLPLPPILIERKL